MPNPLKWGSARDLTHALLMGIISVGKMGLKPYVQGGTSSSYRVQTDQPLAQATYKRSQAIPLQATVSGGHKIDLTAGLRWTVGDPTPVPFCVEGAWNDAEDTGSTSQVIPQQSGTSLVIDPSFRPLPDWLENEGVRFVGGNDGVLGGSYDQIKRKLVPKSGKVEVHHMPVKCSWMGILNNGNKKLSEGAGPALLMDLCRV